MGKPSLGPPFRNLNAAVLTYLYKQCVLVLGPSLRVCRVNIPRRESTYASATTQTPRHCFLLISRPVFPTTLRYDEIFFSMIRQINPIGQCVRVQIPGIRGRLVKLPIIPAPDDDASLITRPISVTRPLRSDWSSAAALSDECIPYTEKRRRCRGAF